MSETPAMSAAKATKLGPGRLILVVGPSGAGKDTLLNFARAACVGDDRIVFPRRVVTRQASAFEDNAEMDEASFQRALAAGEFAVHWEAHGLFYGLPRTIDDDIRAGRTIVVNVSRTVIAPLRDLYAHVTVVAITAPEEVLAERLAHRHRASDGDLGARLHRAIADHTGVADVTIVNVGDPEEHGRALEQLIRADVGAGEVANVDH